LRSIVRRAGLVLCLVLGAGLLLSPAATAKKKAKTKTVTKATTVQNPASVPIPGGTNNLATSTFLPGSASSAVTIPDSGTLTKVTVGVQVASRTRSSCSCTWCMARTS
jgi:hypothetical protein